MLLKIKIAYMETTNLPTHSIDYKIYMNTDLLQTRCPYSNPYIRHQY